MKITGDRLEISPEESIPWGDVETLRLLNETMVLVLENGKTVEFSHVHPVTIDRAFRAYENYLRDHPEKRRKKA